MKSVLCLALASILSLALAGCGENPTKSDTSVNEAPRTSTKTATYAEKLPKTKSRKSAEVGPTSLATAKTNDTELTRQIRRDLMSNKDLSMRAKNVRILVKDGKVTLKGTVADLQEREKVRAAADARAGNANVNDRLSLK